MIRNDGLLQFLQKHCETFLLFDDGAAVNPVKFPFGAVETEGAILFADLPGYSSRSSKMTPVECAYFTSHFFAWFEGQAGRRFGGIVDKFIGDEVMVVFPQSEIKLSPLEAAMQTARAMLDFDPYGFDPKIGIANGPFAVALVGTERVAMASAMGNTVNLAARCCCAMKEPHTIRIASEDLTGVKQVFQDDRWDVRNPSSFDPRNMASVHVIDVFRRTEWIANFDYFQDIRESVKYAREKGVIKSDFCLSEQKLP
jgi:class 3 adenylate cyclase